MKKQLRFLTAALAAGAIVTGSMFTVNAYAADTTTTTVNIDARPHFDTSGYVVINGLQFQKTSDTTVAVSKGMDFNASKIEIPSSISVDDVRYSVTSIAANAFKNTAGDGRVYAAQKISIPTSINKLESQCFYDLVNIESLDLSSINYYYYNDHISVSINKDILNMNNASRLNRVKMKYCYIFYEGDSYRDSNLYRTYNFFSNNSFKPVQFCDEFGNVKSCWFVKDSVRINELQDPDIKDGYTFSGWKAKTTMDGRYVYNVKYINYTPLYEKGQPLWDAEDKIKSALNNLAVNEDTKQSDILKLVQSCLTFDNISYTIDNFRIVPSQNEVRGALRCTINLINKNDNSKQTIDVDKYLTDLPEIIKIKSLMDNYNYKESTSSDDILNYLKTNLDDIGLNIEVNNFSNDKRFVKGNIVITNKLDGLQRKLTFNHMIPDNIKLIIEDAVNNLKINSKTKQSDVESQIRRYIQNDEYDISIVDFENANGKVTGTIVAVDKNGLSVFVDLNKSVQQRSQNLEKAYEIVKANLEKFTPSDTTTEEEAIKYLSNGIEDSAIDISISNFKNKNYTVKGTIKLYDVDTEEIKTLDINKTTIEGIINLNINDIKTNKDTTEDDLYRLLKELLGDDVDFEFTGFKNDNGHITVTMIIHDKGKDDITVKLDKVSVSQTVQEAVDIINKNLTDYVPTNTTKGTEVITALTKGIKDADITVTIPDFNNDGQTVTGTIVISKNDGTSAKVTLNKKTALVGGNTGGESQSSTGESTDTVTRPGTGGSQADIAIPSASGITNNSSTSTSSATGGNSSSNVNVNGGNSTNNNTTGNNSNTNTTGNNSISLDNLSISGGGSTSSTGAITVNPNINNNTPINLTLNLNGFELANSEKDKIITASTTSDASDNTNKNNKSEEDELLKLLILKYLQGTN